MNLIAGIVSELTGRDLDEYLAGTVFADLGISEFEWIQDPAGNPYAMAGLVVKAGDLAKIGELLLNEGSWEGRQVIRRDFAREAVRPQHELHATHGFLWWLVPAWRRYYLDAELLEEWRAAGVDERLLAAGMALQDRELEAAEFRQALADQLGPDGFELWLEETIRSGLPGRRSRSGPIIGFNGNGWLGQWIVAYPDARVVAVRLIERGSWQEESDSFGEFTTLIGELVEVR